MEDAVAQTRVEAADNIVATPEIEIEEVTILLKGGLSTQLSYNDEPLQGNTCAIPYSDDGYNISWKSFIDKVEDDTADIKIWLNGVEQTGDGFFLKEVGSYEIKWSTTKDGYIASEGTYVLNINEATFKYDVEFDGNVVEGNSKEIVFDGAEHTVTITSEPTVDIAVTVGGVATSIDDLKFTSVGKYVIGYTIAKHGYTTVYGEFTVNITNAEFDLVEVKVDGDAVADGDVLEYDFDGTEHTITVDTKPADADVNVVVKVDGVDTPIEDLKYAAVGEHLIEYEVSKPGYTTVRGSFTLKINVPDYVVEVNFGENTDYVNDKKLVLVYTNSDAISFKYGPQALTMYDVTSKGYIYDGEEYFAQTADTNVFAVVVDYIENSSLADYEAEVAVEYSVLSNDYVIEAPAEGLECDLNDSDAIELGDVIASFATYHGDEDYYPELMGVVLRADVTNDKKVNGDDNRACATAFEKAFYGN